MNRASGWAAPLMLAMAAACAAFAFVGLDASSYNIDELFAVFVIDHTGGLAEVLRRALTDTHPPAYYFALYGWAQLFGDSERALRLFSALCATGALALTFAGLRRSFSLAACAFAVALGAGSKLFFEEAQEVRNYGLGLLISAALLALALSIHRRMSQGEKIGAGRLAALWLLGLAGAYTHFYLLLEAGAVHLFLLVGARRWGTRGAIVASGLAIVAPVVVYVAALLQASQLDIHHMWFSNAPADLFHQGLGGVTQAWSGLALAAVAILALARLGGRSPYANEPPTAPLALSVLVILGVVVAGLAVSFGLAPSFGRKNLILLGPFFWTLGAWLYDAAAADRRRVLLAIAVVLTLTNVLTVRTRWLPRNEAWRESAAFVDAAPGCQGQPVPVVLPFLFGPSTPFFRDLARDYFYGRYERAPARLAVYTPQELSPAGAPPTLAALLHNRATGASCPVLAWGVHDLDPQIAEALRRDIAATAGVPQGKVRVRTFDRRKVGLFGTSKPKASAYVFERTS